MIYIYIYIYISNTEKDTTKAATHLSALKSFNANEKDKDE